MVIAGWQAQAYDINLKPAWEVGKDRMRKRAKDACHGDISSSHVRNFSMTADFDQERWRYVLLPVYLATYAFQNEVYHVTVNGQTGAVAGQKPVAWLRIWLAIAALLAPGSFMGLAGLLLAIVLPPAGIVGLVIGFILLIAGFIGSIIIFQKARASEEV